MGTVRTESPYVAATDANQYPTLIVISGTQGTSDLAGTAEVIRLAANPVTGAQYVQNLGTQVTSLNPFVYDTINVTYPTGTTESYEYKLGSGTQGTISVIYSDATKGSITTVIRTP